MKKALVLVLVVLLSSSAMAKKKKRKSSMKRVNATQGSYGMAGCGLGSVFFGQKNDMVSQILAATTNGTSGNQTFGITTGTLECTDGGTMKMSEAKQIFVEANQDKIALEMSRGQGEFLSAFSSFYGCKTEAQTKAFGQVTQANFQNITQTTDHVEMIRRVDNLVTDQCGV